MFPSMSTVFGGYASVVSYMALGACALLVFVGVVAKLFPKRTVRVLATLLYRFNRLTYQAQLPFKAMKRRYPVVSSCQIPSFKSLDDIYRYVLGYKRDGVFVELGAFDGESFSNTASLADIGWTGHYVEAIPRFAELSRRRHAGNANVTVHNVAVGGGRSAAGPTTRLTFNTAGPLSTSVAEAKDIISADNHPARLLMDSLGWSLDQGETVEVDCRPVNTLLTEFGVPRDFDVLVVDVEGMEYDVMSSLDFDLFRPKIMIVELNLYFQYRQGEHWEKTLLIEDLVKKAGYFILYRDWINTVFVDASIKGPELWSLLWNQEQEDKTAEKKTDKKKA